MPSENGVEALFPKKSNVKDFLASREVLEALIEWLVFK